MVPDEVIERCKRGDSRAQEQIYQSLAAKMMGVCVRYCPSRADAEDVLHDGFCRLFDKICDFRGDGSFEGWARRIFVSIALSRIRRRREYSRHTNIDHAPPPAVDPDVLCQIETNEIMAALAKLPLSYRTAINLFCIEGYSHREIAESLDMTVENSKTTLSRAKAQLQKILAQ